MEDRPGMLEPRPDNPGDPETAREPSATARCQEIDRHIRLFVVFTTTGAIVMVLYHVINPVGSPLDTIRSVILNMGDIAGVGLVYTIAVALVSKTVGSVSRRLRQLPFRSRERKPRR